MRFSFVRRARARARDFYFALYFFFCSFLSNRKCSFITSTSDALLSREGEETENRRKKRGKSSFSLFLSLFESFPDCGKTWEETARSEESTLREGRWRVKTTLHFPVVSDVSGQLVQGFQILATP